jgi:hypothetical protein
VFVDDDLPLAVSILDFAGPLVNRRPIQAPERCVVEMAVDKVADERRLAIAMCAGQIELTATIYRTVAIIVGFTLKQPMVSHIATPLNPH